MDEEVSLASLHDDESKDAAACGGHSTDDEDDDDVELPPSLVASGAHNQLGESPQDRFSPTNGLKKVTLRPKMKVRADSSDFSSPLGTYAYKSTDQDKVSTSCDGNKQIGKDTKTEKEAALPTASSKWKYVSPQKSRYGRPGAQRFLSSASESFDALTIEDRAAIISMDSAEVDLSDRGRDGLSPHFSESNYATPDNSYYNRQSVHTRQWSINQMPNLPLASSPGLQEQDFSTPGSSQSRRHSERMGLPHQLPAAQLFGATIDEETAGFIPSVPSIEPSFDTPQNCLAPTRASRSNNLLSIPQFAELVVPQLVSPTKPMEGNNSPPSNEEKKEESDDGEPLERDVESHLAVYRSPQ